MNTAPLPVEVHSEVFSTPTPELAHVVARRTPDESAVALVLRARVVGFAVEALCGVQFVPRRDPAAKLLCQHCQMLFSLYSDLGYSSGSEPRQLPQ